MLYDTKWDSRTDQLPTFGRRWHSFSKLDIRPVLWSLRNRPEEWEQRDHTLLHKPSEHEFWTANGFWFYGLWSTGGCSCTTSRRSGSFSFIQKIQFAFARLSVSASARRTRSADLAQINIQFAKHFLTASAVTSHDSKDTP